VIHYDMYNFCSHSFLAQLALGATEHVRTDALPTPCMKELVTQVSVLARPYDTGAQLYVIPEISNDMANWEALTAYQFGPLTAAGTQILAQAKTALFQRMDLKIVNGSPAGIAAGASLRIVSIGRGEDPGTGECGPEEAFLAYLDLVRRGFWATPPPGAGRIIPFWPNDTAFTSDDFTGAWQVLYTPMFPTHEYKKLLVQVVVESFIGNQGTSSMTPYAITTNTAIENETQEIVPGFSTITTATTLPLVETKEVTPLGAMTGIELAFRDTSGLGAQMASKLSITGLGIR
jgi:hypothetical protein